MDWLRPDAHIKYSWHVSVGFQPSSRRVVTNQSTLLTFTPDHPLSRTPPALPSALSHLLAIPAPLIASVQAWPVSFIR